METQASPNPSMPPPGPGAADARERAAGEGVVAVSLRVPADAKPPLEVLFEQEESRLLHFAAGMVGRRVVAEDLVQEAFLRLHAVWSQVENPRAWLYRSLRNLALNHLRDRRREVEPGADTESAEAGADDSVPPAEAMGRMEAVGVLRMLVAEMPAGDRALLSLRYRENLKYRDIGTRIGTSVGNVGYRLHHLLAGLADALRRAGIEGSRG